MNTLWYQYKKEFSRLLPTSLARLVLTAYFDVVLLISASGSIIFWVLAFTIAPRWCKLDKITLMELCSCALNATSA